ncbi:Nickel import system ATP-binding protein NikE OS=Ureibacillus acetophenoni OX=614649 GN=SAMN05877842_10925 PE=3 SV=1 [Ureibacillus acetophenoni]
MQEFKERVPLLQVIGLEKHFTTQAKGLFKKNTVRAVNQVSFEVYEGETLGLVGESGCGKSTTGRTVLRLVEPTNGEILYNGENVTGMKLKEFNKIRKDFQMIFQDPFASFDPKQRIGYSLEEVMVIQSIGKKEERKARAIELLKKVGFSEEHYYRYPHEFSGGQRQRIGIARALMTNPKFIVCDEAVSALDVSIQSQILNLLKELQKDLGLSYLFIGHDLNVVKYISDRIAVMYMGEIIEMAPTEELFVNPKHPYTKLLLAAIPVANPHKQAERPILKGDIPSPLNIPSGCPFHTRCPYATEQCSKIVPEIVHTSEEHSVKCHLFESDVTERGEN